MIVSDLYGGIATFFVLTRRIAKDGSWMTFDALTAVCSTVKNTVEPPSRLPTSGEHRSVSESDLLQELDLLPRVASLFPSPRTPTHPTLSTSVGRRTPYASPIPTPAPKTPRTPTHPTISTSCTPYAASTPYAHSIAGTSSPIPTPAPKTPLGPFILPEPYVGTRARSPRAVDPKLCESSVKSLRWFSLHSLPEELDSLLPDVKPSIVVKAREDPGAVAARNAKMLKEKLDQAQAALGLFAQSMSRDAEVSSASSTQSSSRSSSVKRKSYAFDTVHQSPPVKRIKLASDSPVTPTRTVKTAVNARGKLVLRFGPQRANKRQS